MGNCGDLYRLAVYYDIAMSRDVSREVDFFAALYRHTRHRELQSILDIACGPGYHARACARRGWRAVGLDLNREMIDLARQRAAAEEVEVSWIVSDMRRFQLPTPVDMAVCMFDGLAVLLTNEDLVQHLRSVAANLTSEGLYLLECTHPRDSNFQNYGTFRYAGERDGVAVEMLWALNDPAYDPVTGVAQIEVEMRIREGDHLQVVRDSLRERALSALDIQLLAQLSGVFQVVGWYGDFDLEQKLDNSPRSRRMIAVLQKVGRRDAMPDRPSGYLSPKLEGRIHPRGGRGVFAREPIKAGELLAVWGGEVIRAEELNQVDRSLWHLIIQVEEDLYMVSSREGPCDWVNHSCNPNAGLSGQVALVAMRDIAPGEEVCFDYAMSDGTPYDEFECQCGAPNCRGRVTGEDWRRPELWERYAGYFSPYLQRRIDRLRVEQGQEAWRTLPVPEPVTSISWR